MTSRYLTAIRKLLKSYHKKFDCFGKPVKKETKKRKKRKNGSRWFSNNFYISNYNYYCS